jgi:hypothetical protein
MPYTLKPVLFVDNTADGYASSLEQVYTNGKLVRSYRGQLITWIGEDRKGLEYALFNTDGMYQGVIADAVISARVLTYLRDYYGSYLTNCSSFAHFIFTGEFVECNRAQNMAVFGYGMRPFTMVSRVDVGDVVWIAYAEKRIMQSRRLDPSVRRNFLDAKKQQRSNPLFTTTVPVAQKSREPDLILDFCKNPGVEDYHFMICVGHERGQPLWLFQNGYHQPGEEHNAFGMTVGLINPYPLQVPLFAYLKKRR